jgi:hypothetical protein
MLEGQCQSDITTATSGNVHRKLGLGWPEHPQMRQQLSSCRSAQFVGTAPSAELKTPSKTPSVSDNLKEIFSDTE